MANNTNLSYPSAFYQQFIDKNGKPLVGGKLYTYIAGSTTNVVTYKTIGGGTESSNRNTNPIILDMAGMAKLVISTDIAYKFVLFDKNNVKIDEWDDVTAGGSEGGGSFNVYVEGTNGEIDVREESTGLIRRFIISLSDSVKNAISELYSSVNYIINAISNKKDKQQPVTALGSPTKVPVSILQNANGALSVEFDDITFPDWTTAINNAVSNCEKTSNKKNSVTGYESSTTAYPSIKAVVDFVNSIMQNLGGKLITDNGNPFSDSDDLPSTTPYQGVNISDKDYAYVQGTGFAERWSASVSGSDVTWVQEYSINIPVFTPAQQAAIDSGATSTKINNYESHINNTAIHVTTSEKNTWNAKQNAISDLAEIRIGAAAGATALQPSGNGSNVTSTFTAASSRTNISSGEKLSIIFGKIAKWFADLKALAFKDKVSDSDISGTIEDAHIASASTWNGKQNALPTTGTPTNTFAINVSGSSNSLSKISLGQVDTLPISLIVSSNFKVGTFLLKGDAYGGQPYVFGNVTIPNNQWYRFSVSGEGSNYCVITLEPSTGGASSPFNIFKILVDNGSTREDKVMKVVRVPYVTTTSEIGNSETPVYVDVSGELKRCDTSKYYMRWHDTTTQWIAIGTDAAVRLLYAENYRVNYAYIEINNIHPALCYIVCTLPSLTSNEIYDLSIEITIRGNGSSIQGGTAILLIDSEDSNFTILSEYAPDGLGGFLNIPQNRMTLPSNGNSVKYKVYISGHAYRVAKLA
jgi:hypothetical protein